MSYEDLRHRIEEERQRFIEVGRQVMSDGQVSVDEANAWLSWYRERKRILILLKREISLEMRQHRTAYKAALLQAARGSKATLRREHTLTMVPYDDLLSGVQKLLLEGDKLTVTLKKLVADA